jgi:hypothetical protein
MNQHLSVIASTKFFHLAYLRRSKVEVVLSYGSQFFEFIFYFQWV